MKCYGNFCVTNCGEDLNLSSPDLLYSIRQGMQSAYRKFLAIRRPAPGRCGCQRVLGQWSSCLRRCSTGVNSGAFAGTSEWRFSAPSSPRSRRPDCGIRAGLAHGVDDVNQLVGCGGDGSVETGGTGSSSYNFCKKSNPAFVTLLLVLVLDTGFFTSSSE